MDMELYIQKLGSSGKDGENWTKLSKAKSLPWTSDFIELYVDRWDWAALSANQSLPWSESLIIRFQERWIFRPAGYETSNHSFDYHDIYGMLSLSDNPAIPWTQYLLDKFSGQLSFPRLAIHGKISSNLAILFACEFKKIIKCGRLYGEDSDFVDEFECLQKLKLQKGKIS